MRVTDGILIIGILIFAWAFYRAQHNPNFDFDLFDLIMENGRVSKVAVAFMVTLAVTSWILLRLTLDGKLTEAYFGAYGAFWIAPIIARLFSAQSTTSISTSCTTTIEEKTP